MKVDTFDDTKEEENQVKFIFMGVLPAEVDVENMDLAEVEEMDETGIPAMPENLYDKLV